MKFLGFTRIVAYASKVHFPYLTQLGATECIDRASTPIEALVLSPPVKVVYDVTFTGALDAAYDCVAAGGKVTTVRPQAKFSGERDAAKKGLSVVHCFGFYAGPDVIKPIGDPAHFPAVKEHTEFGKLMIRELPGMIEKGVVVVFATLFSLFSSSWIDYAQIIGKPSRSRADGACWDPGGAGEDESGRSERS